MKKKRLGAISLLFVLALSLGACDELDDIPSSGTDGDTSGEQSEDIGGSGQNPSDENEGNNPSSNKDVTISFTPSSVTVKENDTAYFSVTLSDEEAYILSVSAEDPTYIEVGASETINQYYVKGLEAGSTSVIVTAGGEGFNTATASISVTVEADSSSGGGEGTNPDQKKDITISAPSSLSVAATEKTYFTIGILPEDNAIAYSVVSSDTTIADVAQEGTQWYVEGISEGETTLTVTASREGYNDASASISVSVTAAPVYTHSLSITNKVLIPTGWKYNTEDSFTIAGVLNTYKDETYYSGEPLSVGNCSITVYSGEEYSVDDSILNVSGLTISPKGVGTAIVVVTANDYPDLHDYITITVDDVELTTHSLSVSLNGADELTVGDSFSLDVKLTTSVSYGYNTTDSYEETVSAPRTSVNISYDSSKLTETNDFTFTAIGDTGEGDTLITVTWTEFVEVEPETASYSVSVSIAAKEIHYSLVVTNEASFTSGTWWTEDGGKELEIAISYTQGEDTGSVEVNNLISNGQISIFSYPSGIVDSSIEGSKITLTPVSAGTARVTVAWTENAEAVTSFDVSVGEATYKLEITNKEAFQQPWKTTDAARSLSISMTSNREDVAKEVEFSYESDTFTVSGNTFTPLKEGTYTITAIWKGHESAQDSVTVTIDDTVVGAYLDLSEESIVLDTDTNTSAELTAVIYGEDHETLATNQEISWSYEGEGISLSSTTGSKITVTAVTADSDAVVTATSVANGDLSASCSVRVNAEAAVEAHAYLNDFAYQVVTTPDNNGVYVFGNEEGNQFISAAGADDHYYNAASITVLAVDGGYNLLLDGLYLKDDLTTSNIESDAAVFTIDNDGSVKLGSTSICLGSTGLILGDGSQAYLIDQVIESSTGYTASGSGFFYAVDSNGRDYYWSGASTVSSSTYRLTTTTDINEAARINLVNQGGNKYYMTYTEDGSTKYITFSSSNLTMTTNESYIYYDVTNGIWSATETDSSSEYGIFLNSSSGWFTSYQISAHLDGIASSNNVYPIPTLMNYPSDEEMPDLRGINITAADTQVMAGSSTGLTIKYYPSCITRSELTWTFIDDTGGSTDSAYVEDGALHLASTATAGSTITATATSGSISGSVSIIVQAIGYIASESMTAANLGLEDGGAFDKYDGTLFTLSADLGTQTTSSNRPKYYTADNGAIRIYANNNIYFDLHEGVPYPIEKIVITSTSSYHNFSGGTYENCTIDDSNTTVTITPTDGLSQIYIKPGAQVRIVSLVVYYNNI